MTHPGTVLLINPDWRGIGKQKQPQFKRIWQPLDLAIAAALLEKKGVSVQILDNNIKCLSPQEIGELSDGFDKIFVTIRVRTAILTRRAVTCQPRLHTLSKIKVQSRGQFPPKLAST